MGRGDGRWVYLNRGRRLLSLGPKRWKAESKMADLGGMADKAKDAAKDNPEKVDQLKDKAKDAVDGNKDDEKK
ncbi:hypothetical protein GCM10017708_20010 [Arthrobacter citreus]